MNEIQFKMKKIFYVAVVCLLATFWFGCQKNLEPYVLKIGDGGLMVQCKDLGAGDKEAAQAMCGNSTIAGFTDWRLPTSEELMLLYNNRKVIGGFLKRPYWSCNSGYNGHQEFNCIDFKNGLGCKDNGLGQVRAVRTIDPTALEESGELYVTIQEVNLMVQKEDLGEGNWSIADARCKASRLGGYTDWRLPTEEELAELCARKSAIGGFMQDAYWSVSIRNDKDSDYHQLVNFEDVEYCFLGWARNDYVYRVRAVRYINPPTPEEPEEPYATIPVANLMVQKEDLGSGNWSTADAMCKASTLADYTDWRLPTKDELMILYTNRNLIGGFQNDWYWSSTESNNIYNPYWCINFTNGAMNYYSGTCRIRAVRFINPPTPEEPVDDNYVTIPELRLMVLENDLPLGEYAWEDAKAACEQLRVGGYTDWRLPTISELAALCERKSEIGGLMQEVYWTGSKREGYDSGFHQLVNFEDVEDCFQGWARDDYAYHVRAVRTITE